MSDVIELTLDGATWSGPMPKGEAAEKGYDVAIRLLTLVGHSDYHPNVTPPDKTRAMVRQLAIAQPLRAGLLEALAGWTIDGIPVTDDSLKMACPGGKRIIPWVVALHSWEVAGFFHVPVPGTVAASAKVV